jgi:glycerol-1-phosphatase
VVTTGRADLPVGLAATDGPLVDGHDLLLVDLDGVAYLGDQPIAGAAEALSAARSAGTRLIFVTNNASRPPAAVADQLMAMGVAAKPDEVMTSAIAAANELAGRLPADTPILVVGGAGVREALVAVGLRPVTSADDRPAAVVQGFAPDVGWAALAEACVALRAGAEWVATNTDVTLPSPRGELPGNGSLVAALVAATGMHPHVIGKPEPALFAAALAAGGGTKPLVIGDRLDTDIAGAHAAGLPSLLVLSGVSTALDLLLADQGSRPHFVGRDLRALSLRHPAAECHDGVATCGPARVSLGDGEFVVEATGADTSGDGLDGLDGLRAACALAWSTDESSRSDRLQDRRAMYQKALADLDVEGA